MMLKYYFFPRILLLVLMNMAILFTAKGQLSVAQEKSAEDVWQEISPFFEPPAEFRNQYGDYSSLLEFDNGKQAKRPGQWKKRRNEILNKWHDMMGQWPPLLKDQEMEVLSSTTKDGYIEHKIRFYWLPEEKTDAYLLVPEGSGKKPAVVTVYYEPETAIGQGRENRDFAYQLAKRGFVTLSIGTTETTDAKTYALYYPDRENAEVQPLSLLAYAAANAWYLLADLPEVDDRRIGIMGHSYGGKWAMFASCLFDKYACAVWSDPGIVFDESRPSVNYWEPWYLGYHQPPWRKRGMITADNPVKGLYPQLVEDGHDLHELHALMAPRPFLVSGGSEDPPERWIPLNRTIEVNNFLGYKNRVAMTNRPEHSPNPESNEQAYLFLEYFLKLAPSEQINN